MKKLFSLWLAGCLAVAVSGQKVYFLYLQTDDQSPFYVRLNDRIFSSSTAGYLILPNLADSTYAFGIGFAKSTQPETRFSVAVNQGDKGYLIKNFTEGLGLFDMQELSVVKPVSANRDNTVYETKTDKFSATLSKAADDPSLLKVPVVKKEEPKAEPEKKVETVAKREETKRLEEKPKDTVVAKPVETVGSKVERKEEPVVRNDTAVSMPVSNPSEDASPPAPKKETPNTAGVVEYKPSTIMRRSESSTTEGLGIVYLDRMSDRTDTVRILIPPSKSKIDEDTQALNPLGVKKEETPVVEMQTSKAQTSTEPKVEKPAAVSVINSSCANVASDKDFMKLRKNMAARSSDDDMISEAKKVFKGKCFSTEQIRYLSTLFLTPAAKYQFFDIAYNFVSDKQTFPALQTEIKDEYFLKRFKALVGE